MTYPVQRSLNDDLSLGMTDGKYRSECPNRGGMVEDHVKTTRGELDNTWYGNTTAPYDPVRPDGIRPHQRGRLRSPRQVGPGY